MSIVERMFAELQRSGLKEADLARCLSINSGQITMWKKRNTDPPAKYILPIANFLGVSVDYLLGRTDLPEQSELTANEEKLLANNRELNDTGQEKLLEYSEDLVDSGKYNKGSAMAEKVYNIKIAARNGKTEVVPMTDSQLEDIMNLPDVDDL